MLICLDRKGQQWFSRPISKSNLMFPNELTDCKMLYADISPGLPLQGGRTRMPQEKEGIRQVSGKPCGRVGKPKQDTDRGVESSEGHLLPQSGVAQTERNT